MRIEFFYKKTGIALSSVDTSGILFVMSDVVYRDDGEKLICFDDFINEATDIGWRVVA